MNEFEVCLERRALVRFEGDRSDAVAKEMDAARSDLLTAGESLERENWKWAIVQGYYAMFHAARALVLREGYVEKSHQCLLVAFRTLFGAEGPGRDLASALAQARALREDADYGSEYDEDSARTVCAAAEKFLVFAEAAV